MTQSSQIFRFLKSSLIFMWNQQSLNFGKQLKLICFSSVTYTHTITKGHIWASGYQFIISVVLNRLSSQPINQPMCVYVYNVQYILLECIGQITISSDLEKKSPISDFFLFFFINVHVSRFFCSGNMATGTYNIRKCRAQSLPSQSFYILCYNRM